MKVHIYKADEGKVNIFVKRTMMEENPSRTAMGVEQKDVEDVTAKLVSEMRANKPF